MSGKDAEEIGSTIIKYLDGKKPDDVMAALTAVTGTVLAAIGIPPGEALNEAIAIYVRQVREHHAASLESLMDHIRKQESL